MGKTAAASMDAEVTAYLGKPSPQFFEFKRAMAVMGHKILYAHSTNEAKELLKTRGIKTIVVNLGLDDEQMRLLIVELRKVRPQIKVLPGGSSLAQVVEDNFFAIAHNIDGTITVEQLRSAVKKVQSQKRASRVFVILALLSMFGVVILAAISSSPLIQFLGVFWFIILLSELACCLIVYRKRWVEIKELWKAC